MIVEDDPGVRRVLEFRLKASGNSVTAVESGRDALAILEREQFDIVLTDLCMPGMDGIALLKEVKRLRPDVQVIILTAYGTIDTAIEALRDAQAFDYLSKPVDVDALNSRIQAALAARSEQVLVSKAKSGRFQTAVADDPESVDPLTGFPGADSLRRAVCCLIGRSARARRRFPIVMLDVDHFSYFKLLNGKREGDHLLAELAALIRQNIRKGDFVFRIGEDRFAIILQELDDKGAEAIADRIRGCVARYVFQGGEKQPLGRVTVSVGVSMWDGETMDAETVIGEAVDALEKAKDDGRNLTRTMRIYREVMRDSIGRRTGGEA